MKRSLIDEIQTARRELRIATGEPLTPEQLEQERQRAEVKKIEDLAYRLGMSFKLSLYPQAVWSRGAAAIEMKIDEGLFYLRPDGEQMRFVRAIGSDDNYEETLILTLEQKDPQFVNRLLVALGDALAVPPA
jgi:hypothetical protein